MIKGDGTSQLHGYFLRKGGIYIRCILETTTEVELEGYEPIPKGTKVKGYIDWEDFIKTSDSVTLCFFVQHPNHIHYFEWCYSDEFKVVSREIMEEDIKDCLRDGYTLYNNQNGIEYRVRIHRTKYDDFYTIVRDNDPSQFWVRDRDLGYTLNTLNRWLLDDDFFNDEDNYGGFKIMANNKCEDNKECVEDMYKKRDNAFVVNFNDRSKNECYVTSEVLREVQWVIDDNIKPTVGERIKPYALIMEKETNQVYQGVYDAGETTLQFYIPVGTGGTWTWESVRDYTLLARRIDVEEIKEGTILKAFGLSNDRYIINKIEDGLEVRGMENNVLFTDDDNIEKLCDKLNDGLITPFNSQYRPYGFTVEKYGENKPIENPKNKYTLMEILVDGEDGDQYKSRGGDISIYKTGEGIVVKSPWKNVNISANETFTLVDKKKPVTLYGVRHKPNGKIYDFVLKDDVMPPCKGDIVVVEDSQGVHYVKVDRIKEVHLSSEELEKYKFIIANL
ncbi:MAG: hypothetical protein [Bacteriophage sp.]|nr:MAG: hypothetical protein [Bacteriophage sp.]